MRLLPPLDALRTALPMCDASAAALVDALLACDGRRARRSLVRALSLDPPLALWCAVQATAAPPRNAGDLADWLIAQTGRLLAWPAECDAALPGGSPMGEAGDAVSATGPEIESRGRLADAAAGAVVVATCAKRLAESGHFDVPPDEAYLAGLLASAVDALPQESDRPSWSSLLRPAADPAALAACVALAKAIVRGDAQRPRGSGLKRRRLARLRDKVRRRWLAEHRAAGWLPALVAWRAEIDRLREARHGELEAAKLASLAEFAAGAGHEINNPLAVISGRAQLLLRDEHDPERRRDLAVMHAQAMRVHEMIGDLMLFARPPRPRPETFELPALLATLAAELSADLAAHETTLSLSCPAALAVSADRGQLLVALRALCDNALFAIGRGGRIDLAASRAGQELRIVVRDDGPGIPAEVRPHLFDPYFSGRSSGRGLGMGLAKCWRIVTQHGGRIDVGDAAPGAEFTIVLPASIDAPSVREA